ncbi:13053_t:CDS:2 [Entrophospora sp. SA101]|nr:13053_t:CDS:2 [Entrophospora sp. SA101]
MHAGSTWKDLGHNQDSCKDLYAQLQNLKKLALKNFAVTPSSACYECIFSSLELEFVAQDKIENDARSLINAAYNTLEEDDDENNNLFLKLLHENNDDSEPRDDIELDEETEEIEDYDPAQLASNYLTVNDGSGNYLYW